MDYRYIALIVVGVIALVFGFWSSFEARKPYNFLGSLLAPVGLVAAIIGILLLCVPDFFSG